MAVFGWYFAAGWASIGQRRHRQLTRALDNFGEKQQAIVDLLMREEVSQKLDRIERSLADMTVVASAPVRQPVQFWATRAQLANLALVEVKEANQVWVAWQTGDFARRHPQLLEATSLERVLLCDPRDDEKMEVWGRDGTHSVQDQIATICWVTLQARALNKSVRWTKLPFPTAVIGNPRDPAVGWVRWDVATVLTTIWPSVRVTGPDYQDAVKIAADSYRALFESDKHSQDPDLPFAKSALPAELFRSMSERWTAYPKDIKDLLSRP